MSLTTSSWNNTTIVATLPSSISLDSELVITNDYSKTDTYTDFSVVGAPGSISISPSTTISLTKGDSTTLSAILRDENGVTLDGASFVWSDNTSGMVTLTDANTDTVTITADDVVNGTIDVTSQGITQLVTVNVSGTSNAEIVSCVQPGGVKLDWTNGAGIDAVTMNDVILEEIKAYDGISINNIVLATNANSGSFITNDVYAGSSIISKVYLDAHNSVGNGIDIDYEITVDSGATWKTATSGEQITFATGGTDIRLRSTLQRLTSDLRPEIYYARLVFGDFDLNEGKSFKEKLDASLPGNYVYSTKNCSTSSYQIGSLRNVNGIWMAAVEGSYSVQGGDDQYIDPGTIGVYDQETDEYLLTKYLKLNLVQ
ncbi:MAG: hypothetical protein U9Q15_00855 [Patescibacteria group bacterium]|nr:hypothetical protein [Patescibacteria group bacterium]